MPIWGRIMTAIQAGVTTFREGATIPDERREWKTEDSRAVRYALGEAMDSNTIYREIDGFNRTLKHKYSLYKHTQGIYNLVYRLNRAYANKAMGGTLDWEGLQTGAIQVVNADDHQIEALLQVFRWSKWGQNKTLFARQTAKLGDCALWIVDDPMRQKVRMEVMHPGKIKDAQFDEVGNIKSVSIEYQCEWANPASDKVEIVTRRMDANKDGFAEYKDDQLFAWNGVAAEWDNEYGFVPLVIANFEDVGLNWGASASYASLNKIHAINDLASLLVDNIRKSVDTWWYVAGARAASDLKPSMKLSDGTESTDPSAQRDKGKFLYGPAGSQPHAMVFPLAVSEVAMQIKDQIKEVEDNHPILALSRMRDHAGELSGKAISNLYGDAIEDVNEFAGNLFDAQIRATQMAIAIGGHRGYKGFRGFSLDSYDKGDLDYYFKEPELFDDELTPKEQIEVIQSLPENPAAAQYILEKIMEIPKTEADEIIRAQTESQERQARAAARGLAEHLFGPQGEDTDDDGEIVEGTETKALTAPQGTPANNGNRGNPAQ